MPKTHETARTLLAPGKGLLVLDEYVDALIDRLAGDRASAADYVDLVLGAPGLQSSISGILLTGEAFSRTHASRGRLSAGGDVAPLAFGVRMDAGQARLEADARRQLGENLSAGAVFAEWRANLSASDVATGEAHIDAEALAQGAAASQAEGVLPLVTIAMPDLVTHSAAVTQAVTGNAVAALFSQLRRFEVDTSALVLRVNMVVAGEGNSQQATPEDGARATLKVISDSVPNDVPGIVFLSGGQPLDQACENLSAITERGGSGRPLAFAFTRALVSGSLEVWQGDLANVPAAQRALVESCRQASQSLSSSSMAGPSGSP